MMLLKVEKSQRKKKTCQGPKFDYKNKNNLIDEFEEKINQEVKQNIKS